MGVSNGQLSNLLFKRNLSYNSGKALSLLRHLYANTQELEIGPGIVTVVRRPDTYFILVRKNQCGIPTLISNHGIYGDPVISLRMK